MALSRIGAVTFAAGSNLCQAIEHDPVNGFLYAICQVVPGRIVKIDVATFSVVATLALSVAGFGPFAAAIDVDNGFLYVPIDSSPCRIFKIDLATFTEVTSLVLAANHNKGRACILPPGSGFLYVACYATPGIVEKINLATFTSAGSVTFNAGEGPLWGFSYDKSRYLYAASYSVGAEDIVKVDTTTMTRIGAVITPAAEANCVNNARYTYRDYAYFTDLVGPGEITKLRLSDFTLEAPLVFAVGNNSPRGGFVTQQTGFLVVNVPLTPNKVKKIRLSDFTEVDSLDLNANENTGFAVYIDETTGYGYVGLEYDVP